MFLPFIYDFPLLEKIYLRFIHRVDVMFIMSLKFHLKIKDSLKHILYQSSVFGKQNLKFRRCYA